MLDAVIVECHGVTCLVSLRFLVNQQSAAVGQFPVNVTGKPVEPNLNHHMNLCRVVANFLLGPVEGPQNVHAFDLEGCEFSVAFVSRQIHVVVNRVVSRQKGTRIGCGVAGTTGGRKRLLGCVGNVIVGIGGVTGIALVGVEQTQPVSHLVHQRQTTTSFACRQSRHVHPHPILDPKRISVVITHVFG